MRPRFSFLNFGAALTVIAAVATSALGCAARPSPTTVAGIDMPSRDFHDVVVTSTNGQSVALSALLGRRPALLSFWAPWCEPCVRELPDLERLSRAVAPCGASVVGVAVGETPASVAAVAQIRQLTYPQFADQGYLLADALGQTRIPTTVVFDKFQRMIFVGEGLDSRAVSALAATMTDDDSTRTAKCAIR
jgi:thiol-disulfide isomerase/thioredoxin